MGRKSGTPNLILFYLIAFSFTWAFWVPLALAENDLISLPDSALEFLTNRNPAAWGPLIGAIITIFLASGWVGLRGLGTRMLRFRFGLRWYVAVLVLIPAIVWAAGYIAVWQGAELPPSEAFVDPVVIPVSFIWIFFLGGPLQEEAGWRGVATEGFQKRIGALGASLTAGLFWGLWHLPLFYMPREDIYYNQPIWGLVISTMLLSVLLTWVYNNTNRSLLAVMLMHTSWNWANYLFTSLHHDLGGQAFFGLLLFAVAVIVVAFGPKTLSRQR